jgi:sugar O-acyltransferase (sialic acid O-acetyltransferase NeuD family)
MSDKIVIIGGKGTAVVIADQIIDAKERFGAKVELLGFAFDDLSNGDTINGLPILCGTKEAYSKYEKYDDVFFIYQLYRFDLLKERIKLRESLSIPINRYYTFVHPSAYVAKSATIGYANIILAHNTINANARLGNFNTVNSGGLIGHDTVIGNNNFVAGHACIGSGLKIGNGNFVGLNASLKNMITVGDYNIIGMASNVVKSIDSNLVLVGNPAKPVK